MNILLIHQYFKEQDLAGGVRFNQMTKVWMEQGHNITVIAGTIHGNASSRVNENFKGRFVTKTDQDGITVWRCYVSESYNSGFWGRLWGYFSFIFSGLYAGLFKVGSNYDVILVSSPPLFVGIIAYLTSLKTKVPFVFEVRDLWPESVIDTGVLKSRPIIRFAYRLERLMYKKAALINVLTPAFREALLKKKNVPGDKIIMVPNAADFEMSDDLLVSFDRNEFRKRIGADDRFVVTYVGAHGVANGLYQVLEAAKLLADTNVLFLMIGNGISKTMLVKQAEDEGIKNVRFIDPMPKQEVLKYVIASDMGASVLLKNDTFKTIYSNKTFDYMSCKTPILMAIDGVSRELVEMADAGCYIEPENPGDFAEKIRESMRNPELIKKQGENGYLYAKQNFDRRILAEEYLKHLEGISSRSRHKKNT